MSVANTQITVPTANSVKLTSLKSSRRGLIFKNHDATNFVVIGGSSAVSLTGATGGVQLKSGETWNVPGDATVGFTTEEYWAIASTGAVVVGILESTY